MRALKAPFRLALPLAAALALGGCSLRLNDPVAQPQHSVSAGSGCLSSAGDVLDRFQKGTLSAAEHAAFFDCTHKALSTFLENTDGKNKDYFTPEELGGFLTKYFLRGKPIQPALLSEAMALKAAVVGGSAEHLSREDLRRIMEVCVHLRQLTEDLRPLMPLSADSLLARGFSGAEFDAAMTKLVSAFATFGDNVKEMQGPYPFERLSGLIRELRNFLYPNGVPEGHWTTNMMRAAIAAAPAKQLLIAPPRDEITPSDWPKIYHLAPRYYASVLRVQFYLASPFNTFEAGGLATIEKLFSDFLATFNYVVDQHPGQQISSEEIDDLLQTAYGQGMLPCKPETARQFIKVVFGRLLSANSVGAGGARVASDAVGAGAKFAVTKDSLSRFDENVRFLLEGAHGLEALYRPKFGDKFVYGSLSAAEIEGVSAATLLAATKERNRLSREAIAALQDTPRSIGTVFPGTESVVVIPEHGRVGDFSYLHMLKIHALRSVNRLLIQAYGSPVANGLTPAGVETFVSDVMPMLSALGVADPSIEASVPKRLREASLFLYASDGGDNLSMNEALEMEALLLSTLQNAPRIHQAIADACGVAPKKDDRGKLLSPEIPAACFRQQFVRHYDRIWAYLPGLVRYVKALGPDDRFRLFDSMATFLHAKKADEPLAARTLAAPVPSNDIFTISDTQSFLQLPYYVELLFSRFDENGDGLLDNAEAAVAYPVFQPFIATKAGAKGYTNPKDHKAIYNFLLAYRELPTDDKWDYALRRYLLGDKPFTDDRGQVVEIFEKLLSL